MAFLHQLLLLAAPLALTGLVLLVNLVSTVSVLAAAPLPVAPLATVLLFLPENVIVLVMLSSAAAAVNQPMLAAAAATLDSMPLVVAGMHAVLVAPAFPMTVASAAAQAFLLGPVTVTVMLTSAKRPPIVVSGVVRWSV